MDFEANYRLRLKDFGLPDAGSADFMFQGTWTEHFIDDPSPTVPACDCAGLFGVTCSNLVPVWRHRLRATWNSPWKFQASLQ